MRPFPGCVGAPGSASTTPGRCGRGNGGDGGRRGFRRRRVVEGSEAAVLELYSPASNACSARVEPPGFPMLRITAVILVLAAFLVVACSKEPNLVITGTWMAIEFRDGENDNAEGSVVMKCRPGNVVIEIGAGTMKTTTWLPDLFADAPPAIRRRRGWSTCCRPWDRCTPTRQCAIPRSAKPPKGHRADRAAPCQSSPWFS